MALGYYPQRATPSRPVFPPDFGFPFGSARDEWLVQRCARRGKGHLSWRPWEKCFMQVSER
jgi:hypothetical protein